MHTAFARDTRKPNADKLCLINIQHVSKLFPDEKNKAKINISTQWQLVVIDVQYLLSRLSHLPVQFSIPPTRLCLQNELISQNCFSDAHALQIKRRLLHMACLTLRLIRICKNKYRGLCSVLLLRNRFYKYDLILTCSLFMFGLWHIKYAFKKLLLKVANQNAKSPNK